MAIMTVAVAASSVPSIRAILVISSWLDKTANSPSVMNNLVHGDRNCSEMRENPELILLPQLSRFMNLGSGFEGCLLRPCYRVGG